MGPSVAAALRSTRFTSRSMTSVAARKPRACIALRARALWSGSNTEAHGMSAMLPLPSSATPGLATVLPRISPASAAAAVMLSAPNYRCEGDVMPEITDILAIFGRIDQIASEYSEDQHVEATVERLLPGTAGYHQGWYSQVERFLQSVSGA